MNRTYAFLSRMMMILSSGQPIDFRLRMKPLWLSCRFLAMITSILFVCQECPAPPRGYNFDESKIPEFKLPDPLVMENGTTVDSVEGWKKRRAEILELFTREIYGKAPERAHPGMRFEKRREIANFLDGKAILKEVRVWFTGDASGPWMDLLLIIPEGAEEKPVGCFLALNFGGNHIVHPDKRITLSESWMRPKPSEHTKDNRALESGRGSGVTRWPIETVIDRNYAVATAYYGDIDPDFDDSFENGIHPAFGGRPEPGEWGAVAAWAFGLSRAMDYLEEDDHIDAGKVAVLGHSRLGKASLWAGATDPRFGLVISNNSGCVGAALSKREYGQLVERINNKYPHWFCGNFQKYSRNEQELPVDQHQLIALIAPRPAYVASATEDKGADPLGEFLSCRHAEPVYELLGEVDALGVSELPEADTPVGNGIGYHLRSGKHDLTLYDWQAFLDFADRHFME